MKLTIEVGHQDLEDFKVRIAPLLEEIGPMKRSSMPHCVLYRFEGDEMVAARVYQVLGFHDWQFDGTVFRKKSE